MIWILEDISVWNTKYQYEGWNPRPTPLPTKGGLTWDSQIDDWQRQEQRPRWIDTFYRHMCVCKCILACFILAMTIWSHLNSFIWPQQTDWLILVCSLLYRGRSIQRLSTKYLEGILWMVCSVDGDYINQFAILQYKFCLLDSDMHNESCYHAKNSFCIIGFTFNLLFDDISNPFLSLVQRDEFL